MPAPFTSLQPTLYALVDEDREHVVTLLTPVWAMSGPPIRMRTFVIMDKMLHFPLHQIRPLFTIEKPCPGISVDHDIRSRKQTVLIPLPTLARLPT